MCWSVVVGRPVLWHSSSHLRRPIQVVLPARRGCCVTGHQPHCPPTYHRRRSDRIYRLFIIVIIIIVYFRHKVHRNYNKTAQRTDRKHTEIYTKGHIKHGECMRETMTEIKTLHIRDSGCVFLFQTRLV